MLRAAAKIDDLVRRADLHAGGRKPEGERRRLLDRSGVEARRHQLAGFRVAQAVGGQPAELQKHRLQATGVNSVKKLAKALNEFHQRLVQTNHLYFGNLLIAKISDAQRREDALVAFAGEMARVEVELATESPSGPGAAQPGKGG